MQQSVEFSSRYPLPDQRKLKLANGMISWREQGSGTCIVLLHGISSGSTAWAKQFNDTELTQRYRLLAWDAPGYGESMALQTQTPTAADYAAVLHELLNALGIKQMLLIGHSLGALIASAYTAHYPEKVLGVVLADPAQGYATAPEVLRQQVYQQREQQITEWGVLGYAERRAANLLRPNAPDIDVAQVKYGMSRLQPQGFCQAAWMLAHDNIHLHLSQIKKPLQCWCGEQDAITPPEGVEQLATRYNAKYVALPNAGHASYLDAATAFNRHIHTFYDQISLTHQELKA